VKKFALGESLPSPMDEQLRFIDPDNAFCAVKSCVAAEETFVATNIQEGPALQGWYVEGLQLLERLRITRGAREGLILSYSPQLTRLWPA